LGRKPLHSVTLAKLAGNIYFSKYFNNFIFNTLFF